ncbi:MAG: DNRLRE domain-containing protein, partial [Gammaproteobacteria bacterium]|nr:DNRLRE domain-containing protein [Gammaproteobacteria bacterium]
TDLTQAWVSGQRPNYGVLLKPTGSADVSFRSSDAVYANEHPEFIVTYTCECGVGGGSFTDVERPGNGGQDTYIDDANPSTNFGDQNVIRLSNKTSSKKRGLVKFKLENLPPDANVTSATLQMNLLGIGSGGVASVDVHRVITGWAASSATWNNAAGATPWITPGGDWDSTVEDTAVIDDAVRGATTWDLTALVTSWLDGTYDNEGVMLIGSAGVNHADFSTSEDSDPSVRPKLTVNYTCPCGGCADVGPPPACEADYTPDTEVGQFDTSASGVNSVAGVAYLPEGTVFNGVAAPAGGAWVFIDGTTFNLEMTDLAGLGLTGVATTALLPTGVTFVAAGAFADHLAVSDTTQQQVIYIAMDGTQAGTFSTTTFGVANPQGVAFIGTTQGGLYDERLAVIDKSTETVYIVTQAGVLETSFPSPLPGSEKFAELDHLPGTDKLLIAFDSSAAIYDFGGNLLRSYPTTAFGGTATNAVAIYPPDCRHVIVDKGLKELKYLAVGGGGPQTVLLVSGNAGAPSAKDLGMETLMTGWGFSVDWIDDGDTQTNFNDKMAAADVVYVSGTVSGPSLLDKVTGVNKGVVNEINGKLDNFGFSSGTSSTASSDRFTKTDALHYITESFLGSFATVFTSSATMPVPGGTLAPDLQNAGEVSAAPGLVTLDAGAERWDGNPAPARRAHLPFTNVSPSQLTPDGELIMQRTILWAAGTGGGGGGGGPTGVVFEEFTERKYGSTQFVDSLKPPGTTEGDLLIATVATDGSTAGSMSPPAGWTAVDLADQSGAVTYGVWWKLAGASEPASYTFSWSGSEHAYGTVMRFTGHDPVSPIDVAASAGGSSSAPSSPAVTTTVTATMILRLGGFDDDDITTDAPGLTGHTAITMDDSGNGPATASSGAGYVMQAATGDSGTSSFALTGTEEYRTVTLAIAPAP